MVDIGRIGNESIGIVAEIERKDFGAKTKADSTSYEPTKFGPPDIVAGVIAATKHEGLESAVVIGEQGVLQGDGNHDAGGIGDGAGVIVEIGAQKPYFEIGGQGNVRSGIDFGAGTQTPALGGELIVPHAKKAQPGEIGVEQASTGGGGCIRSPKGKAKQKRR